MTPPRVLPSLREWLRRAWGALSGRRTDHDLQRELAGHLALAEDELRRKGYAPLDAARLARAAAGGRVQALEVLREPRAVSPLLHLLTDPQPEVRGNAARALGRLGDSTVVPALVAGLHDPVAAVREQAAWALTRRGVPAAVPALLVAVADPDGSVRSAVFRALGAIGDDQAIPRMQQLREAGVEGLMAGLVLDRIAERRRSR